MPDKNKIPGSTIMEVVGAYMILSHNDKRKYFMRYLMAAKWAWKDLLKETIWSSVSKYVEVDKSSKPYSIEKPKDMLRFLNVSVPDPCNNIQNFSFNNYMNVLKQPKPTKKCSTHGCVSNGLCDSIDSFIIRTKDVEIDGTTFTEKIWSRLCNNGDYIEVREVPAKDYETNTITTLTVEKRICTFETNDCGCIVNNEENRKLIVTHCGCILACQTEQCSTPLSKTPNSFGTLKIERDRIFLDTDADWVILSYQTNGDGEPGDLIVPEVAIDAMLTGIEHYVTRFSTRSNLSDKEYSRIAYSRAKRELVAFLNPLRIDEILNVGWSLPKWGAIGSIDNKERFMPRKEDEKYSGKKPETKPAPEPALPEPTKPWDVNLVEAFNEAVDNGSGLPTTGNDLIELFNNEINQ